MNLLIQPGLEAGNEGKSGGFYSVANHSPDVSPSFYRQLLNIIPATLRFRDCMAASGFGVGDRNGWPSVFHPNIKSQKNLLQVRRRLLLSAPLFP